MKASNDIINQVLQCIQRDSPEANEGKRLSTCDGGLFRNARQHPLRKLYRSPAGAWARIAFCTFFLSAFLREWEGNPYSVVQWYCALLKMTIFELASYMSRLFWGDKLAVSDREYVFVRSLHYFRLPKEDFRYIANIIMGDLKEVITLYQSLSQEWDRKPPNLDKCGQLLAKLKVVWILPYLNCNFLSGR